MMFFALFEICKLNNSGCSDLQPQTLNSIVDAF